MVTIIDNDEMCIKLSESFKDNTKTPDKRPLSDYILDKTIEKFELYRRIFNVEKLPEKIDDLPQETSMQRAFAKWLKAGNTIDEAFGAFIYPYRFRK